MSQDEINSMKEMKNDIVRELKMLQNFSNKQMEIQDKILRELREVKENCKFNRNVQSGDDHK